MDVRLYASPDRLKPPIPYIMPHVLLRFDWEKWLRNGWCQHVIIDCAVEQIFFKKKLKDYPDWYWTKFNQAVTKAKNNENVWVVIPDYPDDYEQGMTYEQGMDNVDKTFRNIERFIHTPEVNWLPVIQSRYLERQSFLESCKRMKKYNPKKIGIGTICKTRNLPFIHHCLKTARSRFPDAWIHAFGFTLKAMPFARHYINSADSSSHITWLLWERRDRGWSSNDPEVTNKAYDAFQKRAKVIINLPHLDTYNEKSPPDC